MEKVYWLYSVYCNYIINNISMLSTKKDCSTAGIAWKI